MTHKTTTLDITGMTCAACSNRIEKNLIALTMFQHKLTSPLKKQQSNTTLINMIPNHLSQKYKS